MRRIAIFALILLAGCGAQSEPELVNTTEIVPPGPQPAAEPVKSSWEACEKPSLTVFGNKWWSGLAACEGDLAIDFEADSVLLGGPNLRVAIRTRSCPTAEEAGFGSVKHAFFERPFATQLREVKTLMRRLLSEIDPKCGGPVKAPGLLGEEFDEKFRDLANDWLHLTAKERRKAWARG